MDNTFRDYDNSKFQTRVENTYKKMLENQTSEYVIKMKNMYTNNLTKEYSIWELINMLDKIVDESDPDTDLPQIVHAYQTGESIKNRIKMDFDIKSLFSTDEWNSLPDKYKYKYNVPFYEYYSNIKEWDWFPLIGFIHDLGKVLLLKEFGELPQWSVVGDTFPVGIPLSDNFVFFNKNYHKNNKSLQNNNHKITCGFDNINFSWGHDEFLASILERSSTELPTEAIYIIRYHSFYSWHTPRNGQRGYTAFASRNDWDMLPLLKLFQKADLYSKTRNIPEISKIKEEYEIVIKKYGCSTLLML